MTKSISTNQVSLILCVFTVALKLSALPAIMFTYSGNDSYIACLISLIFDFLGTALIIYIMQKNPDLTFYEIIKQTLGKITAKIIQIVLLLYFLAKAIIVLQELHDYFIATLFEELNPVFFIIVLGLLLLYSATKSFRTIGRTIQLVFWPVLIAITFSLIFPVKDLQIEKLFPIFEQGFYPIYLSISRTSFAFGDYMILLPLMGQITFNKKTKKTLLLFMGNTLYFIFSFFVVFVGSFGKFSTSQTLALGELPLHNTTPATIGKLEWITIIVWTVILLINAIILIIACKQCFDNIFGSYDKNIGAIVITLILVVSVSITYLQLEAILEFAVTPVFASISGLIQVLFIVVIYIAHGILNKKKPSNFAPPKRRNKDVKHFAKNMEK